MAVSTASDNSASIVVAVSTAARVDVITAHQRRLAAAVARQGWGL